MFHICHKTHVPHNSLSWSTRSTLRCNLHNLMYKWIRLTNHLHISFESVHEFKCLPFKAIFLSEHQNRKLFLRYFEEILTRGVILSNNTNCAESNYGIWYMNGTLRAEHMPGNVFDHASVSRAPTTIRRTRTLLQCWCIWSYERKLFSRSLNIRSSISGRLIESQAKQNIYG